MKRIALVLALLPSTLLAQPAPGPVKVAISDLVPESGPVPGLPGYRVTRVTDHRYCANARLVIDRPKKPAAADAQLAAVFDLAFPTDLDFSPGPAAKARREASLKKFNAWVTNMTAVGNAATAHYTAAIAAATSAEDKLAAAARIVQVQVHLARLLRFTPIPKDVRTGEHAAEKSAAFCEKMEEVSEPLDERARSAFDTCAAEVANHRDAWWAPLCTQ